MGADKNSKPQWMLESRMSQAVSNVIIVDMWWKTIVNWRMMRYLGEWVEIGEE